MPEFDRTAAILAALAGMDDDTTARLAQITFTPHGDHGALAHLRESIAAEYRQGNTVGLDQSYTASLVGADVAGRGDQMARFAAVADIDRMPTTTIPDENEVYICEGDRMGAIMRAALRVRFTHAADKLLTHLEQDADQKASHHPVTHPTDTGKDTGDATREPLTSSDVLALASIVHAAHGGQRVARTMAAGEVVYGVARHIVTDDRAFLACDLDDIRDCFLRVTGSGIGLDHFWPVAELMAERKTGDFCVDVPPPA